MKPLILVTNDDSIKSRGIEALARVASEFGDVWVVAPEAAWSAKSHAVTLEKPLYFSQYSSFPVKNVTAVVTSGTPADCVKLALHKILPRRPDFIFSGINHGSNYSVNLLYSGTVAAVIEGAMQKIPSAAFSLDSHNPDADLSLAIEHTRQVIQFMVQHSQEQELYLNVNIPAVEKNHSKGLVWVRQAMGKWTEEFVEREHPVSGKKYYWLTGKFINFEPDQQQTDVWAVENRYTAIVPLKIDLTNYVILEKIKNLGV